MRRSILGLSILFFLAGVPALAGIPVSGTVTAIDGSALSQARVELLPE